MQVEECEPLVSLSAGGAEYADRVHKLGHTFMARLVALKRLADAVERQARGDTGRCGEIWGDMGRYGEMR